jgi:hypothetical protein
MTLEEVEFPARHQNCLSEFRSTTQGNPSMDNLAAIFAAVRTWLNVGIEVRSVDAASRLSGFR